VQVFLRHCWSRRKQRSSPLSQSAQEKEKGKKGRSARFCGGGREGEKDICPAMNPRRGKGLFLHRRGKERGRLLRRGGITEKEKKKRSAHCLLHTVSRGRRESWTRRKESAIQRLSLHPPKKERGNVLSGVGEEMTVCRGK